MKNKTLLFILLSLGLLSLQGPSLSAREKLDPKYEKWLKEEVNYLITDEEKEIFLDLKTDLERNIFIRNFWARFDPIPLTPVNEFKEEHYKRLAVAREKYGIFSDRGRIYTLLGSPNEIKSEHSGKYIFPCEIWTYYNLKTPGFPRSLRLIFYKQWGFGEFKLYSPLFDGLEYLVPHRHYDFKETRIKRLIINALGIEFFTATESVTPGYSKLESERVLSYLRDSETFNELRRSPRPVVTTYVAYEKITFDLRDSFSLDAHGNYLYDVAISVLPEYLTFERSGEKYYGREDIYVTVTDGNKNVISQFNDRLSLELTEEEFETQKTYCLTYKFSETLIPGEYNLKILLRDFVTNRIGEKEIRVSLPQEISNSKIILASKIEELHESDIDREIFTERKPFVYDKFKIFPRISNTFNRDEDIYFYYQIYSIAKNAKEIILGYSILDSQNNVLKKDEERRMLPLGREVMHVVNFFSPGELKNGKYQLLVNIYERDSEEPSIQQRMPFIISSKAAPPGEFSFENVHSLSQDHLNNNLGIQYLYQKNTIQAKKHFNIALSFSPGFIPAKINLAKCYTVEKNFSSALELLIPLLKENPESSEIYTMLGNIYYHQRDLTKAIAYLEKASEINFESIDILNFLGSVFLENGQKKKAKQIFEKSLEIKENQPLVKSILQQLRK